MGPHTNLVSGAHYLFEETNKKLTNVQYTLIVQQYFGLKTIVFYFSKKKNYTSSTFCIKAYTV